MFFSYLVRLVKRKVRLDWGVVMKCNPHEYVQRKILEEKRWEPHVTQVFFDVLKGGELVIDVGANIGYFTLLASRLVGAGGRIVAFEPSYPSYCRLIEHLVMNECRNVIPLNIALSHVPAGLELIQPWKGNEGAGTMRKVSGMEKAAKEHVIAAPLDNILPQDWWPQVSLIKIDTEGWESFALQGMERFLASYRPVILMEMEAQFYEDLAKADSPSGDERTSKGIIDNLFSFITSRGYRLYGHPTGNHPVGTGWIELPTMEVFWQQLTGPHNPARNLDLCLVPQGTSVASVTK